MAFIRMKHPQKRLWWSLFTQLRSRKQKNMALVVLLPFGKKHEGTHLGGAQAQLNRLCVLDLPRADNTFSEPP